MNPLEMEKKNVRIRNRSILLSEELGPNYDFGPRWARNRREKSDFNDSASELTITLEMVKKTCQALESLNSDVRARS